VAQLLAAYELHGDEADAVGFVDLVDDGDVRMLERGRGARFLDEALPARGVGDELGRKDLQRDVPAQAHVSRAVDDPHPAAADFLDDLIVRDGPSDQRHAAILARYVRPFAGTACISSASAACSAFIPARSPR